MVLMSIVGSGDKTDLLDLQQHSLPANMVVFVVTFRSLSDKYGSFLFAGIPWNMLSFLSTKKLSCSILLKISHYVREFLIAW